MPFTSKRFCPLAQTGVCVRLKGYLRYELLFYIVAIAFILLSARGAEAEADGFDKGRKADTCKTRVLNLLRIGYHYIQRKGVALEHAFALLRELAAKSTAPNWG